MKPVNEIFSNLKAKGMLPMLAQTPTSIAPLKIGIFGEQGTGKTFTAALLAAALSKQFHNGAPVQVSDPELGWQFPKRRIFDCEGIELRQRTAPTFKAMLDDLRAAEASGACVYAVELAKPWMDLLRTVQKKCGDRWGQELVKLWDEWVTAFLNSPLHCIALARVSDITEDVLNDEDQIRRVKVDEGMKAGGQRNNFGYEPHLVLRMSREIQPRKKKGKLIADEGRMMHRCYVLKDRASEINGKCFRWPDRNGYKAGGFDKVWADIAPHFAEVQACSRSLLDTAASSESLVDGEGRSAYSRDKQDREIAIEKFDALMGLIYPGQTADEKRKRALVTCEITGTLSRTELESNVFTPRLKWAAEVMAAYAERIKSGDFPANEEQLKAMVALAKKDVADPSREKETVLEDALKKTMGRVKDGKLLVANGGTK